MYFFTGFLIGITSLIPGISGGTVLVLVGNYNTIFSCISKFKNNLKNLVCLIIGILLGALLFARIMELLFYFIPNGTLIIISSFIIYSLPKLIKTEVKKINKFSFFIGMSIIFLLSTTSNNYNFVVSDFPKINLLFLLSFMFYGALDGFFTIIPGISGSMMMMILGPYFLYKSFLANLSLNTIYYAIPLLFYFLGDIIGIFFGSKFSLFMLKKIPTIFMSIIFGMVMMSSIILLPKLEFTCINNLKYILFFLLSFIIYANLNIKTK